MSNFREQTKCQSTATDLSITKVAGSKRWYGGLAGVVLDGVLAQVRSGRLTVVLPDGQQRVYGPATQQDNHGVIRLNNWRPLTRVLMGGDLALAESYMDGDWDSPDLSKLFHVCAPEDALSSPRALGLAFVHGLNRLKHLARPNSKRGSKRNIAYHYDLGNRFYERWLDPSMTYSSALFSGPDQSMTDAQDAKYHNLIAMMDVRPGMRVLEIGCGWGGLAEILARDYGCHVTGITLSEEQHAFATDRMARAGLSDRVDIRLQDYRDVSETYDRIASIEMFEAVGEKHWPQFFNTVKDRLSPDGIAAMQIITIANDRFDAYREGADFIQRYIFPGGMLPSPSVLDAQINRAGLSRGDCMTFGGSYARTLAIWARSFQHEWPAIRKLGFDARFKRMWEYYLAYCEAGFGSGTIDVCQVQIKKP